MARRRRKGRFKRTTPDMGWWVSDESLSFEKTGIPSALDFSTVFEFDDIDSDDSLITQDKSDWFIKRVIVDVYPQLLRNNPLGGPARIWQCAIGTMEFSNADFLTNSPLPILNAGFYERWRRLFKTYTRPVYTPWLPALSTNGTLATQSDDTPVAVADATTPFGPSSIHDDFSVSNAGLVDNSGLVIAITSTDTAPGPGYFWQADDSMTAVAYVRVLLQKRRT